MGFESPLLTRAVLRLIGSTSEPKKISDEAMLAPSASGNRRGSGLKRSVSELVSSTGNELKAAIKYKYETNVTRNRRR